MARKDPTKKARAREREQGARLREEEQEKVRAERQARAEAVALPVSLAVFALSAAVYFRTLHPTIPGGDGGELITAASTLGIAHPPGYPLMTLLGKLFTLLPIGSVAWRVNLMTALFGAAAAGLLCYATVRWAGMLGRSTAAAAGLAAGGLFAFSPLVWRYSVGAEVFALNNLFSAALLSVSIAFLTTRKLRFLRLGAFLLGLGLCNHHTLIFYGAPIALFLIWEARREVNWRRELPLLAGLFFLGLLPYAYLPIAAARHPPLAWGDPSTPRGFFRHLLRSDYGTFQLGTSAWGAGGDFWRRLGLYLGTAFSETLYLGLPLAAVGVFTSLRKQARRARALALCGLVGFCGFVYTFTTLSNIPLDQPLLVGVQARFWQQPNLIVCAWLGLGLAALWERALLPARLALLPAAAAVFLQLGLHFKESDQRHNTVIRDFGARLLESLDRGAILITTNDVAWTSVNYLQLIEKLRTDVVVQHQDIMSYPWNRRLADARGYRLELPGDYFLPGAEEGARPLNPALQPLKGFSMRQFLRANYLAHPIYMVGGFSAQDWNRIQQDFHLYAFGVAFRLMSRKRIRRAGTSAAPRSSPARASRSWSAFLAIAGNTSPMNTIDTSTSNSTSRSRPPASEA